MTLIMTPNAKIINVIARLLDSSEHGVDEGCSGGKDKKCEKRIGWRKQKAVNSASAGENN